MDRQTYTDSLRVDSGGALIANLHDQVNPDRAIYSLLDTNGDGTGTKNAKVNGSSAAVAFKYTAAGDTLAVINRMIVFIEDNAGFTAAGYGGISALSNGIIVKVHDADGVEVIDMTDGVSITGTASWGRVCYDVNLFTFGSGNNFAVVRWTFANSGRPISLLPGYELRVSIQDDLTGLVGHYFTVQGFKVKFD